MLPHDLTLSAIALLVPLALVAFAAEAVMGFGAVLLVAAVGALALPLPVLLPALVPLDLALCATLAIRHRAEIDWAFLLRRVLPAFVLGLPFGALALGVTDPVLVRRVVGAVVAIAAAIELWRGRAGAPGARPSRVAEVVALGAAGASHYGASLGGLVVVYVAARALLAEGRCRATLLALWTAVHVALMLVYLQSSRLGGASVVLALALAPSCAIGGVLGAWAQARMSADRRRALVFGALLAAGVALTVL